MAEQTEEFEVIRMHPNWFAFKKELVVGIVLLPVFGLGLFFIFKAIIKRRSKKYIITNKKVIIEHGIFSKMHNIIPLKNIRTLGMEQSLCDRMLNNGTVYLGIPGGDKKGVPLNQIKAPAMLIDTINMYR